MAEKMSDFDRGALAVFDLMARLRGQLQDFAQELRQNWPWEAVSWDLDCGAGEDGEDANLPIDLWLELRVDPEQSVCWSLDLGRDGRAWEVSTNVEIDDTSADDGAEPTIVEVESKRFDSFELAHREAPDLLARLLATRQEVEAHLNEAKSG